MNVSTYDELHEILNGLCKERDELQKNIDANNLQIHEAQCFADEILSKDEEDFKVFSPRKYEDIYRTELDESYGRKNNYEKLNGDLIEKRDKIASIIHVLEAVASDWKKETEAEEQRVKSELAEKELNTKNKLLNLEFQEITSKKIVDGLNKKIIQNLLDSIHKIEMSSKFMNQDPVRSKMELFSALKKIQDTITEVQNIGDDLCPIDFEQITLKQAFENMIYTFYQNKNYQIDINIEDVSCESKVFLITIYRVVQECFVNIRKHANAKNILFHCGRVGDNLVIQIEDDGIGFIMDQSAQFQKEHFGISIMRQRVLLLNGIIEILTAPYEGTKISIEVPIHKEISR